MGVPRSIAVFKRQLPDGRHRMRPAMPQYCDTTAGCFLSGKLKSPMTPPADTLVLLSTPTCHRCKFVARHLDAKGVEYEYIDVTTDPDWRGYMDDNDLKNVPQTVRGDQRVEGVDLDAINRLF